MKKSNLVWIGVVAALLLAACGADVPPSSVPSASGPAPAASSRQSARYTPLPGDSSTPDSASNSSPHAGASLPAYDEGEVVEIREKLFVAQTNDIYLNGEDYIGKTVKYEGIYKNSADWENGSDEVLHFVIRYGPGCCGYDSEAGFEVRWDGEWPEVDDWVEVVGILQKEVYQSGMKVLYVEVQSITVKEERGLENVVT